MTAIDKQNKDDIANLIDDRAEQVYESLYVASYLFLLFG